MCLLSDMQRFSLISDQYLPGELSLPCLPVLLPLCPSALVVQEEEEEFLAVEIRFVVCRNAKANKRGVRVYLCVCVCGLTATMLELAFISHYAYIVQIDICTERIGGASSLTT